MRELIERLLDQGTKPDVLVLMMIAIVPCHHDFRLSIDEWMLIHIDREVLHGVKCRASWHSGKWIAHFDNPTRP